MVAPNAARSPRVSQVRVGESVVYKGMAARLLASYSYMRMPAAKNPRYTAAPTAGSSHKQVRAC
jgi:hypothetical protein